MAIDQNLRSILRPCHGPSEFTALREIWRSSVRATHDFLDESDFERIDANLISTYLPAVTLIVLERGGTPLGFAGVSPGTLEMLFVAAEARGSGIGTALISEVTRAHGVTHVDVNEQNLGALNFYLGNGFVQTGRSERDGDGRPYPILHLRKAP